MAAFVADICAATFSNASTVSAGPSSSLCRGRCRRPTLSCNFVHSARSCVICSACASSSACTSWNSCDCLSYWSLSSSISANAASRSPALFFKSILSCRRVTCNISSLTRAASRCRNTRSDFFGSCRDALRSARISILFVLIGCTAHTRSNQNIDHCQRSW